MKFIEKIVAHIKALFKLCLKIIVALAVVTIVAVVLGGYFLVKNYDGEAGKAITKEVVKSIEQKGSCKYNCAKLANYKGDGKCKELQGGQYKIIHSTELKALCYAASFNKRTLGGHRVYEHNRHYHLTTHDYKRGKTKIPNGVIKDINGKNVNNSICGVN